MSEDSLLDGSPAIGTALRGEPDEEKTKTTLPVVTRLVVAGPYGKQSKERKGRVVVRQARRKSWIEPFRGDMQKPPTYDFSVS